MKSYNGRIPACGVFCGGCPAYTREKSPCKGAELSNSRCEKCKTFHLCCLGKEITHCFQCSDFPCAKLRRFTKSWLKYGQDFIENQKLLKDGKSSVRCPLKPSDSIPLCQNNPTPLIPT